MYSLWKYNISTPSPVLPNTKTNTNATMNLWGWWMNIMIQKIRQTYYRLGHSVCVMWWFLRRPITRGAKCIIFYGNFILLVRPAYGHKLWMIPGGGVKKGETFLEGAHRELKEETGIVTSLKYFFEYQQLREYKQDTVQCFYGSVNTIKVTIDGAEIVDYMWVPIDKLPQDSSPSVGKIIAAYKKYIADML